MPLPAIFQNAALRCVTPICPERKRIGVAFDMPYGHVVRVALTASQVRLLLGYLDETGDQSPISRLIPSSPKSVSSEGVKV